MYNFHDGDPKEKLIAGIGVLLDGPTFVGMRTNQPSIFNEEEKKQLGSLPDALLLKIARALEQNQELAVNFINL